MIGMETGTGGMFSPPLIPIAIPSRLARVRHSGGGNLQKHFANHVKEYSRVIIRVEMMIYHT